MSYVEEVNVVENVFHTRYRYADALFVQGCNRNLSFINELDTSIEIEDIREGLS